MENIIKKLNDFFSNKIKEIYNNHKNKNSRERKIKINDMLKYLFLYSKKENTKEIASEKANSDISRTAFHNKFKNIKTDFLDSLFNELKIFKEQIIKDDAELLNLNNILNKNIKIYDTESLPYEILSADGTCNNEVTKGKLFTNSNVHVYSNTKQEPYNIISNNIVETFKNNKNNNSNKNSEISLFMQFIANETEEKLKNKIFILDRAYSTYDLILKLNEKNVKYIIRLKDNFDILNDDYSSSANKNKIKKILSDNKVKIIKNTITANNILTLSVTERKTIKTLNNYHLITNLGDCLDYNEKIILDLYRSRWDIEVFFKKIKKSLKYETFYLHDAEEIKKTKIITNICFILTKILMLIGLKYKYDNSLKKLNGTVKKRINANSLDLRKKQDKEKYKDYLKCKTYEANIQINFSHFYCRFIDDVLVVLIDGNLKESELLILNKAIKIIKNKKDRKFEMKSLIPFTKWYVKMYHKIYEDKKIYDAITNDTIEKLNKNLKTKAEKILSGLKELRYFREE